MMAVAADDLSAARGPYSSSCGNDRLIAPKAHSKRWTSRGLRAKGQVECTLLLWLLLRVFSRE